MRTLGLGRRLCYNSLTSAGAGTTAPAKGWGMTDQAAGLAGGAQHGLLADLAARTRLREGAAGIEAVLRTIHREAGLTGKDLARQTRLPIPVVTALRRELEKAG